MNTIPEIKLYGAANCHKTQLYQSFFDDNAVPYLFLDVKNNESFARELRGLYKTGKLNFPTITLGGKQLRNPTKKELSYWLDLLVPDRLPIVHEKENKRFTIAIDSDLAFVEYALHNGKMYLNHSEVPSHLRGRGIGKLLVIKTFEKLTDEGYQAVAVCSFIKAIARRDPKWNTIIQ